MKYLVTSPSDRQVIVYARNSTEAKRMACRYWDIKPSDKWCGVTALKAIKINEEGR